MRNYVIINGVNSLTIQGLAIKTMPPITKPIQRTLREEIDGRDGDIVTPLGYGAYDKTIEIGLFGTFDIDEVIAYFNQKGTITFSNEADKVYYFEALDQVDYAELLKFRTANVVLHCQPFKYPTTETPIEVAYEYVEGTGESLTLDNTEASSLSLELKGNTSQVQTIGKNLVPFTNQDFTLKNVRYYVQDGSLYLNGTSTGETSSVSQEFKDNLSFTLPAGTYYASCGSGGRSYYLYNKTTNTTIFSNPNYVSVGTTRSFTLTEETTLYIGFYVYQNTFNNVNNEIMISTSSGSYEPYTYGATPNPNYPQDIHIVSGDNEISITGKNLLEPNQFAQKVIDSPYSSANVSTYDSETGELAIKMGNRAVVFDNFKANTQYTIILKYNIATNGSNLECWYTDNSYDNITPTTGSGTFRFVTRAGKSVASIKHSAYDSTMPRTLYLKESGIFEGVKEITDFEPFGKVYPINLGVENLLDFDTILDYWGAVYTEEDNTYTLTDRGNFYANPYTLNLKVGETYTLSGNKVSQSSSNLRLELLKDSTIVAIQRFSDEATESGHTFVVEAGHTYSIRGNYSSGTYPMIFSKPQLEVGNKANSYTPYGTTPIELCKIGNYQDYFYKDSGKWYKYGVIDKVVLDGNIDWYAQDNELTNSWRYYTASILPSSVQNLAYSDKFISVNAYTINNVDGEALCRINEKQIAVRLNKTRATTKAEAKTYFSNNNAKVYYVLVTPTTTEITDTTLISQLEAIKSAVSYEGQTNISQTNDNKPFRISASALKKGSDTAVVNNTGNIYSKPTIELEGTGIVDIYLNDVQVFEVDLSEENKITIDTEKMEAYTDTGLANRKVTGDYSTFKLNVGTNDLRFSGALTSATITRYLRWL